MSRTFVMVKPDGIQRGLIGEIISRLERKGLKLVAMRLVALDVDLARRHYAEHQDKPFFARLVRYITAGPVVVMAWEGPEAVQVVRSLLGATNPRQAQAGTIRGDLGLSLAANLVHGSADDEAAAIELALHFSPGDLVGYDRTSEAWISPEE